MENAKGIPSRARKACEDDARVGVDVELRNAPAKRRRHKLIVARYEAFAAEVADNRGNAESTSSAPN
jgi:hypothetical protein